MVHFQVPRVCRRKEDMLRSKIYSDAAEAWSWGFQDGGTLLQEGVVGLYNSVMYYLLIILVGVMWMLGSAIIERGSPLYKLYVGMNRGGKGEEVREDMSKIVEIVWTIVPALVLVGIAVPSFKLLYMMDEVIEPSVTLKAVGYQWYWGYEYADYKPTVKFDSYMKGVDDLEGGELRMLEVDNRVVLPVGRRVRILVTGGDVLHSWAVPSLGVKADAIPGRLNQLSILLEREGVYYGQCSELCGVQHKGMPIAVEGVSEEKYLGWLSTWIEN